MQNRPLTLSGQDTLNHGVGWKTLATAEQRFPGLAHPERSKGIGLDQEIASLMIGASSAINLTGRLAGVVTTVSGSIPSR